MFNKHKFGIIVPLKSWKNNVKSFYVSHIIAGNK